MPKKRAISEIINEVAFAQTKEQKIQILRQNDNPVLRLYLGLTIDKNVKWALPVGAPPFKQNKDPDLEFMLYNEARRMYLFIEGGHPTLKQGKREQLFIELLESLSIKDAEFLINVVINKKLPDGLDAKTIIEAYPGIIDPSQVVVQKKPRKKTGKENGENV